MSKSASRLTSAKVFADRESKIRADRFNELDKVSVKSIIPQVQTQTLPPATAQTDQVSVKSRKSAVSKRSRVSVFMVDKAEENRRKILGLVNQLNDSELEKVSELLQEQVQAEPENVADDSQSVTQSVQSVASSRQMLSQL